LICFNGKIIDNSEFSINYNNRFFLYGDGFFETIKAVNGSPLFWEDHYFRLFGSLCMLRMKIPNNFNSSFLLNNVLDVLKSNKLNKKSARVRILFFRDSSGLYYPKENNVSYVISSEKLDRARYALDKKGLSVDFFNNYKLNNSQLNNLKTTNRLINVLGSIYNKENSLDDCIILNQSNNIVESVSGNIFIVYKNKLITPSLNSGCVSGIMRKNILKLSNELDLEYLEKELKVSDLLNSQELFFSNVIHGIKWVSNLKQKTFDNTYSKLIIQKINNTICK